MNDINVNEITQQLIELSNLSPIIKSLHDFINPYLSTFLTMTAFTLIASVICLANVTSSKTKPTTYAMLLCGAFSIFSLLTVTYGTRINIQTEQMNPSQIRLVKSIESPEFQELVKQYIRADGATIDSIKKAIYAYKKANNPKGIEGLELYNNVQTNQNS